MNSNIKKTLINVYPTPPNFVKHIIFFVFFFSPLVFIEPAPFDILFCLAFFVLVIFGHIKIHKSFISPISILVFFLIFSIFSMPLSFELDRAVFYYTVTLYLILLHILIFILAGKYGDKIIEYILTSCSSAMILSLLFSIPIFLFSLPLSDIVAAYGGSRLKGFFKDPNVLGPSINLVFIYLFYKFLTIKSPFNKIITGLLLGIGAIGIFLTYSRAAWASAILCTITFLILFIRNSSTKLSTTNILMLAFGLIILMGSLGIILMNDDIAGFASERTTLKEYDNDRFAVHKILLDTSFSHPLGIGPGQTEIMLAQYYNNIGGSDAAHNSYLRILIENGFLSLLMFVIFLLYTLITGLRLSLINWPYFHYAAIATSTFIGFILCSFVIDTLHWRHMFITSGIIWGAQAIYLKMNSKFSKPLIV